MGSYVVKDMELLLTKFLHVLFVYKKTSDDVVYGELGVCPLQVSIKCRMVDFWVKLLTGKNSKLSYFDILLFMGAGSTRSLIFTMAGTYQEYLY